MIRGLGIDIVAIQRIAHMVERYQDHFLMRVFTPAEIAFCREKTAPEIHYAGRWAAKEAFYKALPVVMQPRATWKSIEIIPEQGSGKPVIAVCSQEIAASFVEGGIKMTHLSISHERQMCTAVVIIE